MSNRDTTARRTFLGGLMAAAAAATLPLTKVHAASPPPQGGHDDWLNRITGQHKCLFDSPQHKKGAPSGSHSELHLDLSGRIRRERVGH